MSMQHNLDMARIGDQAVPSLSSKVHVCVTRQVLKVRVLSVDTARRRLTLGLATAAVPAEKKANGNAASGAEALGALQPGDVLEGGSVSAVHGEVWTRKTDGSCTGQHHAVAVWAWQGATSRRPSHCSGMGGPVAFVSQPESCFGTHMHCFRSLGPVGATLIKAFAGGNLIWAQSKAGLPQAIE